MNSIQSIWEKELTKETVEKIDKTQIGERTLTQEQEIYKENILEHYKHPHNQRKMQNCTHQHLGFNPLCGDRILFFVKVKEERIEDASFIGSGCAISQAATSILSDKIKGKTLSDIQALTKEDIYSWLGIPIGPVRMKCALLGVVTLKEALEQKA